MERTRQSACSIEADRGEWLGWSRDRAAPTEKAFWVLAVVLKKKKNAENLSVPDTRLGLAGPGKGLLGPPTRSLHPGRKAPLVSLALALSQGRRRPSPPHRSGFPKGSATQSAQQLPFKDPPQEPVVLGLRASLALKAVSYSHVHKLALPFSSVSASTQLSARGSGWRQRPGTRTGLRNRGERICLTIVCPVL